MDEKTMVSDALVGVNGELKMFGDMIPQTENKELKQCLKQIRNQCEMSQEKLYQVAREKSYYVPAAKATQQEVDHVKSILTQPKMGLVEEKSTVAADFCSHCTFSSTVPPRLSQSRDGTMQKIFSYNVFRFQFHHHFYQHR